MLSSPSSIPQLRHLLYSTFLGPNNNANPQAIALDANNDAYVLASTSSRFVWDRQWHRRLLKRNDLLLVEIDPAGQYGAVCHVPGRRAQMNFLLESLSTPAATSTLPAPPIQATSR